MPAGHIEAKYACVYLLSSLNNLIIAVFNEKEVFPALEYASHLSLSLAV